jgi:hypothetical protein
MACPTIAAQKASLSLLAPSSSARLIQLFACRAAGTRARYEVNGTRIGQLGGILAPFKEFGRGIGRSQDVEGRERIVAFAFWGHGSTCEENIR